MGEELSLDQIHYETLKVIEKIYEICDMLNISCVAWYGSMLGAIRHKGFIPWDDDFDIAMLRPDYDKFIDYCKTNSFKLGEFKLIDKSVSKKYPFNLARFCHTGYRMETKEFPDAGMGLFVDIYPLDPVGNSINLARKKIQWRKKLYSIGWNSSIKKQIPKTKKGIINKIIKFLIYDSSKYVAVVVWEMSFRAMPKIWFEDVIDVPFESITVKVPRQYDKILKQIYGDYMKLPKKSMQHPTHDYRLYKK